ATCDHLVVGVGTVPVIPDFVADIAPERVIMADDLDKRKAEITDPEAPVVVVGCGQTSAERVNLLLDQGCRNIRWVGRRTWFAPLEDSPTANDLYRPAYHEFFVKLPRQARREVVSGQILTSDGITPGTLTGLFQRNYEARLRTGRFPVILMPGRNVTAARMVGDEVELTTIGVAGEPEPLRASHVVIAAGRK